MGLVRRDEPRRHALLLVMAASGVVVRCLSLGDLTSGGGSETAHNPTPLCDADCGTWPSDAATDGASDAAACDPGYFCTGDGASYPTSWATGAFGPCNATATWSAWSPCADECGGGTQTRTCQSTPGTQTRTVYCSYQGSIPIPDSYCLGPKPAESQPCTATCSGSSSQDCPCTCQPVNTWQSPDIQGACDKVFGPPGDGTTPNPCCFNGQHWDRYCSAPTCPSGCCCTYTCMP